MSIRRTYLAPCRAVAERLRRIEAGLRKGGIDPAGLPLDPVAGELVRREFVERLQEAGAHVGGSAWGSSSAGVEVQVELASGGDDLIFRAVTTEDEWIA